MRKEALNVRVGGLTMSELVRKNIAEAYEFFQDLQLGA